MELVCVILIGYLLGWKAGVLTAVHDMGKASLAVLLARLLLPDQELAAVIIVTVITDYIVCGTLTSIISVPVYMDFTRGAGSGAGHLHRHRRDPVEAPGELSPDAERHRAGPEKCHSG